MNSTLLIKEIRLMLKDLKFQIFFLILVMLFILSAISSAVTYENLSKEYLADQLKHNETINDGSSTTLINMVSGERLLKVVSPPSPAVLFSSYSNYYDKISCGVVFYTPTFGVFGTATGETFRLNWYFILGILSGFIMLIISFEAISSEKRAGTLRLLTVYGFKRHTILWHKYLSYMLLYLIIIIPPALVSLLLFFTLSGTWSVAFMLKFLLVLLLSLPFASFFILIGVFISMLKNYRSAIVLIVFIWLIFMIIIPQSADIIANHISPLKTGTEYDKIGNSAYYTEWNIWDNEYDTLPFFSSISDGLKARAVYASDEKRSLAKQAEIEENKRQTQIIRNIASISPFTQFERIIEVVFDKGWYWLKYAEQATMSRITQIANLMREQDGRDETSLHFFYSQAKTDKHFMQIYLQEDVTTFSEQPFEHPELLYISEIFTEDALAKTLNVFMRLLPILVLNVLMIVVNVLKLERLDIR